MSGSFPSLESKKSPEGLIFPSTSSSSSSYYSTTQSGLSMWRESRAFFSQSRLACNGEPIVCVAPNFPESISQGQFEKWDKNVGDVVAEGDVVCTIETDKTVMDVKATASGTITETIVKPGELIVAKQPLFKLLPGAAPAPKAEAAPTPTPKAAAPKVEAATPTPTPKAEAAPKAAAPAAPKQASSSTSSAPTIITGDRTETRQKMSLMRQRVGQRLKESQNTNALLTTFNEIDMTNLIEMRNKHQAYFSERHGIKLGFMSPFVRAATLSLLNQPVINSVIDGTDIVSRNFVDISVAVATPKGLVVPVLRNCESLSLAGVEKSLANFAARARDNTLPAEDMIGGTFTISNGGVFGSLFGTPIVNPPQSAILGMHATNTLPRVVNGQVVPRPIMYVALTYDHRLIDGREAVTFLKSIKTFIEDPTLMLLQ